MYRKKFTSESVGAGHPDKICDQISDLILDRILAQDKEAKVAAEVMASNRLIVIGGEITTTAYIDIVKAAWDVLFDLGFCENDFTVISNVNKQSKDIEKAVDKPKNQVGAGDQGIMFGFATKETPELMPLPITISHSLMQLAEKLRRSGEFKWAKSDMKAQATIDYSSIENPKIDTLVMSVQHEEKYDKKKFHNFIKKKIMQVVAKKYNLNLNFKTHINPSGKFVIGGPIGDTGLTGRKIIVDTYGGMGRHGGGAFSGKDYTKVDRSASYAARWVAKNVVAANLADKIEIQLSYAIGLIEPVSILVDTFNTEKVDKEIIEKAIRNIFDLSPKGIIEELGLKKPIYFQTSVYGHFGRPDLKLPWEKINKVKELKQFVKKYK